MDGDHALVHEKWVGLPGTVGRFFAEVVHATLLKRRDPGNLTAVVDMVVKEKLGIEIVYHRGADTLEFGGARNDLHRHNVTGRERDRARIEHVGVHMDGDIAVFGFDGFDGVHEGTHVVPVPMGHRDVLDIAELDPHVFAIAEKDCSLGASIILENMTSCFPAILPTCKTYF